MSRLWSETRRVCITRTVQDVVDAISVQLKEPHGEAIKAQLRAQRDKLEAEIRRRKADPVFTIEVRHIGTPDDPLLWDTLNSTWRWVVAHAESWARKDLLHLHGSAGDVETATGGTFAQAVVDWRVHYPGGKTLDGRPVPSYRDGLRDLTNARLEHGLVGGLERVKQLLEAGGPMAVLDAEAAVRAYQEVTVDQGEG